MEDKRMLARQGLWGFVGLTLLVFYVLSIGPFYWLAWKVYPRRITVVGDVIYAPLLVCLKFLPKEVEDGLGWYQSLWKPK